MVRICSEYTIFMLTSYRYDAGDQGKYVVNGGISTAQLLMAYERTLHIANASSAALGDGSLRIPERSNGYPDFLDEARWEMAFILKMQVPANSSAQLVNGEYIGESPACYMLDLPRMLSIIFIIWLTLSCRCVRHGTPQNAR